MFELYKKSGVRAIYHRMPISLLDDFRKTMAAEGKFFKIRYRGPRFNVPSARFRSSNSKQSSCLKEDAVAFSAYRY